MYILAKGFHTAVETAFIREVAGVPIVLPPDLPVTIGMGNGPAILSKFIVPSFKMSVLDSARLRTKIMETKEKTKKRICEDE